MAYYYDPNSYANTLYGGPPPFVRRRPSPPPATYYPREAQDPYFRALAEEQAARAALQDAIKREREARQRRAEEEAKAQMRQRVRERERSRQRPPSMYPYSPGYGYPDYSGYPEVGYPQSGYAPASYRDIDVDEYPQYFPYFAPHARPVREPVRRQQQFQSPPRTARSQSRQPVYKRQPASCPIQLFFEPIADRTVQSPPKQPSPVDTAPKIHIPISSPSDKPKKPAASKEEKEAAASKIQSAYRIHRALNEIKAAREQFTQLISSFVFPATLDFDLSSPPQGEERPNLMYNKNNAPIHAHEDALVRLLQKLDAIESHGDRDVRERRRELVREVEGELERVDKEVRGQYEQVKERTQPAESKEDAMDVEPAQPSTEQPFQATERMDEDAQASVRPSDEADSMVAHQSESQTESQAMDVEPPRIDTSASTYTTAPSSATVEEDPPVGATNDSPAESEVETPPQVPVSLPQPVIQDADSSPQPTHPQADETADIDMQKESVPPESLHVRAPEGASTVGQHKTHRVTVEDADDRNDSEEIVIVEEARPEGSPLVTEKEFVVV